MARAIKKCSLLHTPGSAPIALLLKRDVRRCELKIVTHADAPLFLSAPFEVAVVEAPLDDQSMEERLPYERENLHATGAHDGDGLQGEVSRTVHDARSVQ